MRIRRQQNVHVAERKGEYVVSPFGGGATSKVRDLHAALITSELEKYYGVRPPDGIVKIDYSVWRCLETGLEFAQPMNPGSEEFYEWVSSFGYYYPSNRWEYQKVQELLQNYVDEKKDAFRLLDVGSGSGNFLSCVRGVKNASKYAVDTNKIAIDHCIKKGFRGFAGTVTDAAQAGFVRDGEFPVVTAFHCLEHVPDPTDFVRALLRAVNNTGHVFISTPYSPMSFEARWFDVLNYPPHHLTRWNLSAYRALAKTVNANMRYYVPRSTAIDRALRIFRLTQYGPNQAIPGRRQRLDLLRNLPEFSVDLATQLARRWQMGTSSDVILVELTPKSTAQ